MPILSANPWAFLGQVLRLEAARIHLASESLTLHPAACDGGGGPRPGLQGEGGPPRPSPYAAVCLHWPQAPSSARGLVPGPLWKCCRGYAETLDFLIQAASPWPRRTPPTFSRSTDLWVKSPWGHPDHSVQLSLFNGKI